MPTMQPKNWWVYPAIPIESDQALIEYPAFMRQILFNRGIKDAESAFQFMDGLTLDEDPYHLCDMEAAVDRLLHAADTGEMVAVYGDYDVDGVTATALMVEVLKKLGIDAHRYIPNRFDEGYGLNQEAIQLLADSGIKVILTVDCGIRSPREAEFCRSVGVDLLISDHHTPKHELPDAMAVICPKRENDVYKYKDLAGVGLAYKIAEALLQKRPTSGLRAENWLDLVALGTVSDIVPLTDENRSLVKRGLNLIHQGKRLGLNSLLRVAGRDPAKVNASDIGYILGPRLNAAGRWILHCKPISYWFPTICLKRARSLKDWTIKIPKDRNSPRNCRIGWLTGWEARKGNFSSAIFLWLILIIPRMPQNLDRESWDWSLRSWSRIFTGLRLSEPPKRM